ncbi:MAG: alkaline phosphatase family protein [Chloroflexi bacterium]|nr:alkaline phosphatase family protein [Chloroflexota bacterium]
MNKIHTPKLIALGWDAATWDLLTPWVAEGKLPNLSHLMGRGSYGAIRSTSVPVSPAAWSTIITGQNPARHGVFDWFARNPGSYDVTYVHTGQIKAKTIWDYVNAAGQRIGVFNLPMLYPAVPVEGFMLSGLAAPNPAADDFAFPPDLVKEIEQQVGLYWNAETEVYKYGREQAYFESVLAWLDYQKKVIDYLMKHHPCEVYLLVFMQTDHIQHKFWRYMDTSYPGYDAAHDAQFADAILQVYQKADEILGEWMAAFGEETHFMVLSDHGAGPSHGIMYVNRWLEDMGFLYLRRSWLTQIKYWCAKTDLVARIYRLVAKLGLGNVANLVSKPARNKVLNSFLTFDDIDWSRTKAYSRGAFGQIYVNLKGREPHGIVEPGAEYEACVLELLDGLRGLPHPETGEPLITNIRRREEAYAGPYLEQAADVMFSIQDYLYQTSVKMGLDRDSLLGPSEYEDSGGHRPEGILVMSGPGIRKGGRLIDAQISDVLPTILALAGVSIPADLDGRPLREAFTTAQQQNLRFSEPAAEASQETEAPALNADEITEIEARLRDLGYLG